MVQSPSAEVPFSLPCIQFSSDSSLEAVMEAIPRTRGTTGSQQPCKTFQKARHQMTYNDSLRRNGRRLVDQIWVRAACKELAVLHFTYRFDKLMCDEMAGWRPWTSVIRSSVCMHTHTHLSNMLGSSQFASSQLLTTTSLADHFSI